MTKKQYEANKEKILAANKEWRQANKEKVAAAKKEWATANKEKSAAATKKWRDANKDKSNAIYKRHLLKLSLANSKISQRTLTAWAVQVKERTPFCEWCYSEDNLEAHHIMPKAKYPQYALDINNGRTMCQNCHMNCHIQGGY
jgi:hypothetical protein